MAAMDEVIELMDLQETKKKKKTKTKKKIVILAKIPKRGKEVESNIDNFELEQTNTSRLLIRHQKRWFVLSLVVLLNFSNTLSWIAYAPVANYVNAYYGKGAASWLSLVYMLVSVPFGFAGMWIGTVTSVSVALTVAAVLNCFGAFVRMLSSVEEADLHYRFWIVLTGQMIAGMAYPFIMYLPSKVSDVWFPPTEKTIATTIGVMANPLGIMVANLAIPVIILSSHHVLILNVYLLVICAIVLIVVCFGLCGYEAMENDRSDVKTKNYLESFKTCFTTRTYVLLLFILGGGIGMFNSLYTMMHQMMCPSGYGNQTAGICAVVMIGSGIIGAIVAGLVVDKTKRYKLTMIILMNCAVLSGIGFLWFTRWTESVAPLFFFAVTLGASGLAAYPVGLELALECTYPIAPEVTSGFIVLSGQVFSVLFVWIIKQFSKPLSPTGDEMCRANAGDAINVPHDYLIAIIIITVIAASLAVMVFFIKEEYKRSRTDRDQRFYKTEKEAERFMESIAKTTDTTLLDAPKNKKSSVV